MTKFNTQATRPPARGPIVAEATPSGKTYEGGSGYAHDDKSALFLLAVSNFVGEDTFYENAGDRDERFRQLVHRVAVADGEWFTRFVAWLRGPEANMRSASLVAALEGVKARLDANLPSVPAYEVPGQTSDRGIERTLVDSVLQRADEPGEALAYWISRYGRAIPKPVKRGVADAVRRLYTEYTLLKYDTPSHAFRFGDVIDLVHPQPRLDGAVWQGPLFRYALDRRHGRDNETPGVLQMIRLNARFRALVASGELSGLLDSNVLRTAGLTWEDALSLAGDRVPKRELWEALIPTMGYMALLRNLRNLDEADVPDRVATQVAERLADPEQVARSRQLPFRFLAAYENVPSVRWSHALDLALRQSLLNLPELPGRSLILVDTSASMTQGKFSKNSTMTPAKAAALFGVALAARNPRRVDLYGFADGVFRHDFDFMSSPIREMTRFIARTGEVGHGTRIAESLQATFIPTQHDRVFIISDMQTFSSSPYAPDVTGSVPRTTPIYGFNLGGYRSTAFDAGTANRHEFGGLTDATFKMIPLLEAGKNANWPWQ